MDIFTQFNKKIDTLTDVLISLAENNQLAQKHIELYNDTLRNIKAIQDYFSTGINLDLGLSEKAHQVWQNFETNRAVFFARPYTPISRKVAVKKVLQLAQGSEEDFVNIVEWATALNYKEIMPNILNIIEKKQEQKEDAGLPFKKSKYFNYSTFLAFFIHHKDFYIIDFTEYYHRLLIWSESKNKTSKHWGFVGLQFINNDITKNKLVKITIKQKQSETLKGIKNMKYWKVLTKKFPVLEPAEPLELFRFNLTIKTTKENYKQIENQIDKIKKSFPDNIKFLTYKITK